MVPHHLRDVLDQGRKETGVENFARGNQIEIGVTGKKSRSSRDSSKDGVPET